MTPIPIEEVMTLSGLNKILVNGYFLIALLIAVYLVYKTKVEYRFEVGSIAFFLLTGEYNELLTFSIPGVSFFEIQPERYILLVFTIFLLRRFLFPGSRMPANKEHKAAWVHPWFIVALYAYISLVVISLFVHVNDLSLSEAIVKSLKPLNVLIVSYSLYLIASKKVISIIGKVIIITAVFSSIICLIQTGVDTMFMRVGELRKAFGDVMRATGVFRTERINAYFLIIALAWTLITVDNVRLKYLLAALFSAGVACTFHRMSWLVLTLVLFIYFVRIQKVAAARLIFAGLTVLILAVSVYTFFFQDIMNSSLVQERLSDNVDGRKGYYAMVLDNIGKEPVFGFGGKNNKVYYQAMLEITGQFNRATGEDGGIHSGYFSTLFYYGVLALICYIAFVILAILYFGKLANYNIFFAIPFLVAVVYGVGNITNTLLFSGIGVFYAIHIGLGLGARYMRGFIYGEAKEFKISFRDRLPNMH